MKSTFYRRHKWILFTITVIVPAFFVFGAIYSAITTIVGAEDLPWGETALMACIGTPLLFLAARTLWFGELTIDDSSISTPRGLAGIFGLMPHRIPANDVTRFGIGEAKTSTRGFDKFSVAVLETGTNGTVRLPIGMYTCSENIYTSLVELLGQPESLLSSDAGFNAIEFGKHKTLYTGPSGHIEFDTETFEELKTLQQKGEDAARKGRVVVAVWTKDTEFKLQLPESVTKLADVENLTASKKMRRVTIAIIGFTTTFLGTPVNAQFLENAVSNATYRDRPR